MFGSIWNEGHIINIPNLHISSTVNCNNDGFIKSKGGKIMTDIEIRLDAEPKDKYEKAMKLLLETDKAIRSLTLEEQQKLLYEFAKYKGTYSLFQTM